MAKQYELINEQIEGLKEKGLQFKDEEKAKRIIFRENYYYLITGYEDVFLDLKDSTRTSEKYEEDTYFEELYAIYKFDRELKNLVFDYINIIETNLKSIVGYIFSEKYGLKDYFLRENFREEERYNNSFNKLKTEVDENLKRIFSSKNSDVKEYLNTYGYLPLFVLVKVFTFGNITTFYSLMKIEEKQKVASGFSISPYSLERYLRIINVIRNICAHGGILFNVKLNTVLTPKESTYHRKLKISKIDDNYKYGINDFFAAIIGLKDLLTEEDFSRMYNKIKELINEVKAELDNLSYQNLLNSMGFPENYELLDTLKK
ncbi:MAG: Abi family protein [Clostridia bacterium]|nr:Abi family protein [Clostridia bacterium]